MNTPFTTLLHLLQPVFHLEVVRQGKYLYPVIQNLQDALECYDPEAKNTFIIVQNALIEALPHLYKRHVNMDTLSHVMNALATTHQVPSITLSKKNVPKVSSKIHSDTNLAEKNTGLETWIAQFTGKSFYQIESSELIEILIQYSFKPGFSKKLSNYLQKHPLFFFDLIMNSERNFIKICQCRLILYLTDQQIATAIMKHISSFTQDSRDPYEQVDHLIDSLNGILSNGRCISTLLRNAQARAILFNSVFFQIYDGEEYAQYMHHTLTGGTKSPSPNF